MIISSCSPIDTIVLVFDPYQHLIQKTMNIFWYGRLVFYILQYGLPYLSSMRLIFRIKKTWNIIKGVINRNKSSRIQEKFKLNDGSITTDGNIICSHFNDFFINIGPNLANRIKSPNIPTKKYLGDMNKYSIFLEPVTQKEIHDIIKSLKDGAPGHDEITAHIMKFCSHHIEPPLVHTCNLSLNEGIFPQEMKLANVKPLFKSGESIVFNNYRPVSLLCVLSKVFEKVMYSRLSNFLERFKILIQNQFGFRKCHSSYMALMAMMDNLIQALEKGEFVVGVFLDFSKAFDTVNHDILFEKLYHYGIRGPALQWFKSYLHERKQYVTYNDISSSAKPIKCGVPQGSILGPLLFLIYINDLYHVCENSIPILFADDSNLFFSGTDPTVMEQNINIELENISTWLKVNKLSLNIGKTHYMIFDKQKRRSIQLKIKIENQEIEHTCKTKFLGVTIDQKLTWKHRMALMSGKIARGIGMIIKARHCLNKNALLTLYYSFIYPYLIYCNVVWGSNYASNLQKMDSLQKKVVRIITNTRRTDPVDHLFDDLKIIRLENINVLLISKFIYRVHNGQIPELFEGYFTRNFDVHDHYTRQRFFLHVPKVKRNLGKFGIRYRGVCIWNEILKLGINPDTSEAVFVKTVKKSISNRSLVISWLFFSYCLRFYFQSQVVIHSYYIMCTPIPQTCRW